MTENDVLRSRMTELSERAYSRDILQHTGFLSLSEQALYRELLLKGMLSSEGILSGGYEEAERCVLFWPASYETKEDCISGLICCVKAEPCSGKWTGTLTHRDYLGALMSLGIERECIGDILVDAEQNAYIYCLSELAEYLTKELHSVRRSEVRAAVIPLSECRVHPETETISINIPSERADAVIAEVFHLSRSVSAELFRKEAVSIDGKIASGDTRLCEGNRISVRGFGKMIYDGVQGQSRRGRLFAELRLYR